MKKLLLLILMLVAIAPSLLFAQDKTTRTPQSTITIPKADLQQRVKSVTSQPEVHNQLVSLFGKKYSLENNEVRAQLKKNFNNAKASDAVRRTSLYAYYGDAYKKHISLISNTSK